MADETRIIGLSLGADICWPICYEELIRRLDLKIPHNGGTLGVEVERVSIEPFDLRQASRYDVVIDRLTHWYQPSREWIKKAIILNDLYVFNNPWSLQSNEKQTSYCAMTRLGLPVPDTWMIPPQGLCAQRRSTADATAIRPPFRPRRGRPQARLSVVHEALRRRCLGRRRQDRQ